MDERSSDTAETFGSQDPPSEVSDQNAEEHPGGGGAGTSDAKDKGHSREQDAGRPGGAGEGSQATGHPDNAG